MAQGYNTDKIGQRLVKYFDSHNYSVFYDHGNAKKYPKVVREIQGFMREPFDNTTKIAAYDLMVYDPDSYKALCIVEIEESYSSPKKLLGDILALRLGKIGVKEPNKSGHRKFSVDANTRYVVATWRKTRGKGVAKLKALDTLVQEDADKRFRILVSSGADKEKALSQLQADVFTFITDLFPLNS